MTGGTHDWTDYAGLGRGQTGTDRLPPAGLDPLMGISVMAYAANLLCTFEQAKLWPRSHRVPVMTRTTTTTEPVGLAKTMKNLLL